MAVAPSESRLKRPVAAVRGSLYRVVWRWHFCAGVLVAPVLLVVTVTGALYLFKDELERGIYPNLMFVASGGPSVSYEAQFASAQSAALEGDRVDRLTVSDDPTRATAIALNGPGRPPRDVYVDPRTGAVLGTLERGGVFRVVLDIHRRLFAGKVGRVVVELTTCWTIVLLVSGTYLWWPRGRKKKVEGVLTPRLRAKPYVVLRDAHAVAGFYLLPVALIIAVTGLLYTLVWGSGYRFAAEKTGANAFFANTPKSTSPPSAPPLSLDEAVAIGRRHFPGTSLTVSLPRTPDGALLIFARGHRGRSARGTLVLDRSTGAVLAAMDPDQLPALGWWSSWNYALHVGTVLGMTTKVIWLIACLVLVALPVTGLWMWWQRRPQGATGFPRRSEMPVPRWLAGVIIGLSVLLPTVGLSIVLILAGEWVVIRLRQPRVGFESAGAAP